MNKQGIYVERLTLSGQNEFSTVGLCLSDFLAFSNYRELARFFYPQEREYYKPFTFGKRIKSFLFGRYATKKSGATYI